MPKSITFTAPLWRFSSDAASWYFVYAPEKFSTEIKQLVREKKIRTKGFAFVPVRVVVGESTWETTLFPHKKEPYLLSINKKVRLKEGIDEGDQVKAQLTLL
jgi:hypothetical protein